MTDQDPTLIQLSYDQSAATAEECKRCLLGAFAVCGVPGTLIDIGCGQGHLVELGAYFHIDSFGVDLLVSEIAAAELDGTMRRLVGADLTSEIEVQSVLDSFQDEFAPHEYDIRLVLCWEVAEHLPPSAADLLCDTLATLTRPGDTLLFSAATPRQGGAGHINEQPRQYWIDKLTARGLQYDDDTTIKLRTVMAAVAPSAWWYGRNMLAFNRSK